MSDTLLVEVMARVIPEWSDDMTLDMSRVAVREMLSAAEALGYAIVPPGCEEKMMAAYHRKLGTTGEYQKHDAIRAAIEAVRLTR